MIGLNGCVVERSENIFLFEERIVFQNFLMRRPRP